MPVLEMQKTYMSWNKFEKTIANLADQIRASGIKYTSICGFPRGGLPVAVRLSHLLGIPYRFINYEGIPLLCDDIIDSGKHLEFYDFAGFDLASLYWNPKASFEPKFWQIKKKSWEWIVFPWEKGGTEK